MMKKIFTCFLGVILTTAISGCGNDIGNSGSEDFEDINECNSYGDTGCEKTFENVKFGNSTITLKYEFIINSLGYNAIKVYVNDFPTRETSCAGEITLEKLSIIDEVILYVTSTKGLYGEKVYKLEVFDDYGTTILNYDEMIEDMWIDGFSLDGQDIIIKASNTPNETAEGALSICIDDFFERSSYTEDTIVLQTYKLKYNGDKTFSAPTSIYSETMSEYRSKKCE